MCVPVTKSLSVCSQSGGRVCARHQLGRGHVHVNQELQPGRLRQLWLWRQQERPARLANKTPTLKVRWKLLRQVDWYLSCHRQAVTAGCGGAAATTWASARPSPSSSWTRWRRGRTHGLPWIFIITKQDGRWGGAARVLRCCGKVNWAICYSAARLLGWFIFFFLDVGVWVGGLLGPPTDCTV